MVGRNIKDCYTVVITKNKLGKTERTIVINDGIKTITSNLIDRIYPEDRDNKKTNDENMRARKEVVSIVLPDSVAKIERDAFLGFPYLRDFEMSKNVEEIGNKAFEGVGILGALFFPKTIRKLGENILNGSTISTIFVEDEKEAERIAFMLKDIYRPIEVVPIKRNNEWIVYKVSGRSSSKCFSSNMVVTRCKMTTNSAGEEEQVPFSSERYNSERGEWKCLHRAKSADKKTKDEGVSA